MNKLLVIILVSFCFASVLTKSIKVSDEDEDEENSDEGEDDNENESDENDVPQMDSEYIPKNMKKFLRDSDENHESEDFFQGDIELSEDQEFLENDDDSADDEGGTGLRLEKYRWPKKGNKVIVPYKIDEKLYSEEEIRNITIGMEIIQNDVGCIKFKERSNEVDYIFVTIKSNGCSSSLGKRGKKQRLNLAHSCTSRIGTIVHEFIHALGFTHMQNHSQRDKFVKIIEENMRKGVERNFRKYSVDEATSFDTPYDYYSIMHYSPYAFSIDRKNGKKTIETLDKKMDKVIGQRNAMSPGDIARIQKMYDCPVTANDEADNEGEEDDSEEDNEDNSDEENEQENEEEGEDEDDDEKIFS